MNPVALVTGSSRGIGRGIALELARLGHDLVVNYAGNEAAAQATAADCVAAAQASGHVTRAAICQADVAQATERRALLEFTRATYGGLDLLVNNAGVAPMVRADLLEATEESFDRLLAVNLRGPYFLTQAAARWMIQQVEAEADSARPKPKIVFVTSVSAVAASVNRGDYCVSKAGLSMACALFAARLADHGINVYEVRPGIIATDMTGPVKEKYDRRIADGLTPIRRWGTPEDVGKAVAAIAQGLLPFSTGEVLQVDGGLHLARL